jgi:hypothetical protein
MQTGNVSAGLNTEKSATFISFPFNPLNPFNPQSIFWIRYELP